MTGNILAIEFKRRAINACVSIGAGGLKIFSVPSNDDLSGALKNLLAELKAAGVKDIRRLVAGLDPMLVSMRVIETPFSKDAKKTAEIIPLELSDSLMDDTGAYVFSSMPLEGGKALAAAVEKVVVARLLDVLKENGFEPDWITSPLFLKDVFLDRDDEASAFVDADSLVVSSGGRPVFYKAVSGIDDVALALMSLKADGIEVKRLSAAEGAGLELDSLGIETRVVPGWLAAETGVRALMDAALKGREPRMDFRSGEFADTREADAIRRGLKAAAGFLLLISILWGVHFYLMTRVYASEAVRLDNKMKDAYAALFPGDDAASADWVYRLKAKFKTLDEESRVAAGDVRPLIVMSALSTAVGKDASISALSVKEGKLIAECSVASRDIAERVRAAVDESFVFSGAALSDFKDDAATKRVTFTITATLEGVAP